MDNRPVKLRVVREHAQQLLTSIDVSRIVVVDDEYGEVAVEDLLGLCSVLHPDDAAALPKLSDIDFFADREIWADMVRRRWMTLNDEEQRHVLVQARTAQVGTSSQPDGDENVDSKAEDVRAAKSLADIFDELPGCQYITLSLQQWKKQQRKLLTDGQAENTVFLFDRDFSNEDGSENEGIALVREVQAKNVGHCGLLSHTFNIEGEHDAWRQIAAEHDLNRDTLIIIAKERLRRKSSGYYQFLDILRLVGLSERYANFKSVAWSIFEQSVEDAADFVRDLSVFDFDRVIFGSSRREGVWEPDTLFRVFGILVRRQARKQLYRDEKLFSEVTETRRISANSAALADALGETKASREALRIQRFESYESVGDLNEFHVPIDLGDIFENISTRRRYILLAQPCDLMVRENGKRSYDNKCARTGALVEFVFDGENQSVYEGKKEKESWGELPFYHAQTGGSAFVDFARVHQALLAVLDLCALDAKGNAVVDVDSSCPDLLIRPWRERHKQLGKLFRASLGRYEQLKMKNVKEELKLLALPRLSATLSLQAVPDDRTLKYNFRRVTRLRQPWSGALLSTFAQYQARAAFEHPFDYPMQTQEINFEQEPEDDEYCGTTV